MKKTDKPQLVKVGNHFINVKDVSAITKINGNSERGRLYVVRFISNPNPEYTCWVGEKDIQFLLEQFNIIVGD